MIDNCCTEFINKRCEEIVKEDSNMSVLIKRNIELSKYMKSILSPEHYTAFLEYEASVGETISCLETLIYRKCFKDTIHIICNPNHNP